ncbi:MAG TPA: inositol monophosphatase family protein [Actinomycetota bacterium]|jgi:histidinol-phosphatase
MFEPELAFAHELADAAGDLAMTFFRGSFEVRLKVDKTPVTEADLAIEAMIRERVHDRFPGDGITGEEGGVEGASERRWIVDPIDGTKNFADGVQIWANLIAFEVDGEVVVGVANAPALGERYAAARGDGAAMNGEPIHVSRADRISRAFVLYAELGDWLAGSYPGALTELVAEARRDRGFGDFWGHMLVARGSADVMLEPDLSTWDWAALDVIVREAGGRVSTFEGGPLRERGSLVSTNGVLHDDVLARLAGARAGRPTEER